MQIQITGKKIDIGEALRVHSEEKLSELIEKYSLEPLEGSLVISKSGHTIRAEFDIHLGREVYLRAHAESDDAHFSVDNAIQVLEKRIRKHKSRLIDHQKKRDVDFQKGPALQYVLNPGAEEESTSKPEQDFPLIIAETKMDIPHLTVGEAVMHMDLADQQAIIFHNEAHGRLNVVYRRTDGNIGWIDPTES